MVDFPRPMFSLGQIVATPAALEALQDANQPPAIFLDRHVVGDWGDTCAEDSAANDEAIDNGYRIFSVYHTAKGVKLYVITESDRSSTTVLRADEY